jgi:hypothetical protein
MTAVSPLALAGCVSFSEQVREHTLAYNFAQEDIANQTFLLNALRARDSRPMHFTTLSKVTGKLTVSGEGELGVPFGGNVDAAGSVNSLTPSLSVSSSPSFDVVPENKSAFMRGITTPVTLGLFSRYWHQGWPKDLLVHLLIRKIEVVPVAAANGDAGSRPIRVFVNAPDAPDAGRETCTRGFLVGGAFVDRTAYKNGSHSGTAIPALQISTGGSVVTFDADRPSEIDPNNVETDWCRYEVFKFFIDLYLPRLRLFEGRPRDQVLQATSRELSIGELAALVEVAERKGVSLERTGDEVIVKVTQSRPVAVCIVRSEDVTKVPADASAAQADEFCPPGELEQVSSEASSFSFIQESDREPGSYSVTAHFRSAQSVVFYLGEILRAHRGGRVICIDSRSSGTNPCPDGEVPLFVVRASEAGGEVAVPYLDGKTYSIPSEGAGRSMTALSLLTQIFALSRQAAELPSTSTVNVIN